MHDNHFVDLINGTVADWDDGWLTYIYIYIYIS
jgi:hypothetical protein